MDKWKRLLPKKSKAALSNKPRFSVTDVGIPPQEGAGGMAQSPPEAEPYDFQFERDLLTVMGRMDEYIEFTIQIIPNELELQIGTSGDCWWKTATKRTSADEKMYLYIAGQYIRMDDSPLLRKNELKMAPIERLQTLTRRRHENFGRSFVKSLNAALSFWNPIIQLLEDGRVVRYNLDGSKEVMVP